MKRLFSVWLLIVALLAGGAAPAGSWVDEVVMTQWSAQAAAKGKKKNKKKKHKKNKRDKKKNVSRKKNKSSNKKKKASKKHNKHSKRSAATVSSLAAIPHASHAPAHQAYQPVGNAMLRVGIPASIDNTVVNYKAMTVNFNPSLRIPNCVAYELTATMVAMTDAPDHEVRKNYNYAHDPNVRGCPQNWEYRGSGYTRGHMAPAMDMRWDKTTMAQCFMMTNMCPQEKTLNNDDWRRLEERVHRWAKRDGQLLIFTGPIMGNSRMTIGKERADIAVPEAFFKVVYAPRQQRAIAFIYPNRACPGSYRNYAVTVQEVERRTGLTFNDAIPKRQCDPMKWE